MEDKPWYKDSAILVTIATATASLGIASYGSVRRGTDPDETPLPRSNNTYDRTIRDIQEFRRDGIPSHLKGHMNRTQNINSMLDEYDKAIDS